MREGWWGGCGEWRGGVGGRGERWRGGDEDEKWREGVGC